MRNTLLPFNRPSIGDDEISEVVDTLKSDWLTTGPKTKRFEGVFAEYVDAPAALGVSSATAAMEVALATFGIGPGTEVITTAMTFCSTVHVIERLGATPVLVDVEPDTLCVDPKAIEAAVTAKTRAILPVHIYGHPCEMDAILEIAGHWNLLILEDAAHSLPAKYKGRTVGSIGTATAFSFYATKNMTTAEGGMLTGDEAFIDRARTWSLHGMSRDAFKRYSDEGSWFYEVEAPGFKCNMTDVQAALGLAQLRKLDTLQVRRREIVAMYQAAFAGSAALELPVEREGIESAWHIYPIRLEPSTLTIGRDAFIQELKQLHIATSVHFIPIHLHRYYRERYGWMASDYPVAYENFLRMISLPLYPQLTDADVADVIEAVLDVVDRHAR